MNHLNPNVKNETAVQATRALAQSEGLSFTRMPYDPSRPYWPSHVTLDGLGARVMGRHADAGGSRRFTFDKLRIFKDIEWLVLVCLPTDPDGQPVLYRIPRREWERRSSITIDLLDGYGSWYDPYRWSPPAHDWMTLPDEAFWRLADEALGATPAAGPATAGEAGWSPRLPEPSHACL